MFPLDFASNRPYFRDCPVMKPFAQRMRAVQLLVAILLVTTLRAEEAKFFRGIVLNGPALTIDGQSWEGKDATNFTTTGKRFENQSVPLKPPTDARRTRMIRSSVWGDKAEGEFSTVPAGD